MVIVFILMLHQSEIYEQVNHCQVKIEVILSEFYKSISIIFFILE